MKRVVDLCNLPVTTKGKDAQLGVHVAVQVIPIYRCGSNPLLNMAQEGSLGLQIAWSLRVSGKRGACVRQQR